MAADRKENGPVDLIAMAVAPVLIMAQVGSLVFFLLEILYAGNYSGELKWMLFFFVFGAVLICRISMQADIARRATLYGAVMGRGKELATLQTLGFTRRALSLSLVQEAVLLAAAASLLAAAVALLVVNGAAVRFTMGAFALCVDSLAILVGCGIGLMLGLIGAIPPAIKAMRYSVVEGLKAI